jgi:hypothetical protein
LDFCFVFLNCSPSSAHATALDQSSICSTEPNATKLASRLPQTALSDLSQRSFSTLLLFSQIPATMSPRTYLTARGGIRYCALAELEKAYNNGLNPDQAKINAIVLNWTATPHPAWRNLAVSKGPTWAQVVAQKANGVEVSSSP